MTNASENNNNNKQDETFQYGCDLKLFEAVHEYDRLLRFCAQLHGNIKQLNQQIQEKNTKIADLSKNQIPEVSKVKKE